MKILLQENPLAPDNRAPADFSARYRERPAWITPGQPTTPPEVTAFRLQFDLPAAATIRVHLSADERYLFYLDGQPVGRGPERGSDQAWFYESHDLSLTRGRHTIVVLVWQMGALGPQAQIGLAGGLLFEAEGPYGELLSTKSAAWQTKPVAGISFRRPDIPVRSPFFVQPIQITDGASYPWGIETGAGAGWEPAIGRREDIAFPFGLYPVHRLQPALLPDQMASPWQGGRIRHVSAAAWTDPQAVVVSAEASLPAEMSGWQALLDETKSLVIPAHTQRQVIIDLEQYVCAYPQLQVSGGKASRITIGWAEALHLDASGKEKGQRDEVDGRTFIALCRDVCLPDGGARRQFEPLWWRAGRFVQLLIETGEMPLTIEAFNLLETRYPLDMTSKFSSSDARLDSVLPVILRGLQMCAHETYMDCPYYEQLMYIGDTRLEALITYVISPDDRLPRKAIFQYERSRLPDGLPQARYPSRDSQVIAPFALWWIGMVYDYAMWRGDRAFVASMLPGVRAVLDGFLGHVNRDNLLRAAAGWNFTDWTSGWPIGVPPEGFDGVSGVLNWHLVYALELAARVEAWAGEALLAQRWQGWRDAIATAATAHFWDEQRGLFADDLAHANFSEHTQCLALLAGVLDEAMQARVAEGLLNDGSLTPTTIYFSHYLFETYYLLRQPDAFMKRMALWFELPAQGFKTTPEQPEPSRSDCHGWGAHPLYHYFATLLGIRPVSFAFEQVVIEPMAGHLTILTGEMVHPKGLIQAALHFENDRVRGDITLPAGLTGTFRFAGKTQPLAAGRQQIEL
ncbi:MAG: hypothetical protein KDE34_06560 [Anaerolineales bacterium]|nr:hypothetical protein [Anaerolineales bacterium]